MDDLKDLCECIYNTVIQQIDTTNQDGIITHGEGGLMRMLPRNPRNNITDEYLLFGLMMVLLLSLLYFMRPNNKKEIEPSIDKPNPNNDSRSSRDPDHLD